MPSVAHEAPLVVLREAPDLVPTLLRRSLGLSLPPFESVEISDAGLTQVVPAELAGLVHGDRATAEAIPAAAAALTTLPDHHASLCYDLLSAALSQAARLALEDQMLTRKYEFQTDFARAHFGAGLEQGLEQGLEKGLEQGLEEGRLQEARSFVLTLAERHGPVGDELRARVAACADTAVLRGVAVDLASAADPEAVRALLARLP